MQTREHQTLSYPTAIRRGLRTNETGTSHSVRIVHDFIETLLVDRSIVCDFDLLRSRLDNIKSNPLDGDQIDDVVFENAWNVLERISEIPLKVDPGEIGPSLNATILIAIKSPSALLTMEIGKTRMTYAYSNGDDKLKSGFFSTEDETDLSRLTSLLKELPLDS